MPDETKTADAKTPEAKVTHEPGGATAAPTHASGKAPAHPRSYDIMDALEAIDAKAKAQGHSLVEIIVKAASTQFGIDVRPDAPEADETA